MLFSSDATNLHPVSGILSEVFRVDRDLDTLVHVSRTPGGEPGNLGDGCGTISDDGNVVAFESSSYNFGGGAGGYPDVIVRDIDANTTTFVTGNGSTNASAYCPQISANASHVAFGAVADMIDDGIAIPGGLSAPGAVYRYTVETGALQLVNVSSSGGGPDAASAAILGRRAVTISDDGRYVGFVSGAGNLVEADTNGEDDVFRRDMETETTVRVSTTVTGGQIGSGTWWETSMSGDGGLMVFHAPGNDVESGTVATQTGFAVDVETGRVQWVLDGPAGTGINPHAVLSGDGRYLLYRAGAQSAEAWRRDLYVTFTDVLAAHVFLEEIWWMAANLITTGYEDGTYRPAADVSRQAMAAFMYRLTGSPPFTPPASPSYTDVPTSHPFFEEVEWMNTEGVTGGFPDGGFHPSADVTRQGMAAFMYRLAGSPPYSPPASPTFPDVPAGHAFFKEVEWLASTDITTGFADGSFDPGRNVTRQAMSAFMQRFDECCA